MSTTTCVAIPFSDQAMAAKAAVEVINTLGYTCAIGVMDYEAFKDGSKEEAASVPVAEADKFIQDALDLPPDIQKRLYRCLYAAGNRI